MNGEWARRERANMVARVLNYTPPDPVASGERMLRDGIMLLLGFFVGVVTLTAALMLGGR